MGKIAEIAGRIVARQSIEFVRLWHLRPAVKAMRRLNEIQLSTNQLIAVMTVVKRKAPCKLLVFGLGYDSVLWSRLNRRGVTVFLEDNEEWYQKITKRSKSLEAFLVRYNTRRSEWKTLLQSPSLLQMALPAVVEKDKWDVILVDGPAGGESEKAPGRMKSIFLSAQLVKDSGDVFVHDAQRPIEDAYCNAFLKKERLILEISAYHGELLRHYHITSLSTLAVKEMSQT